MLAELSARDFRNLEPLTWRPGAGRHLLVGDNGAGKTSLLEAAYVLATTRSFRTSRLADCRRHGSVGFTVEGEAEAAGADGGGRASLSVGWDGEGRRRRLNGRVAPLAEHLAALPVVAWTAADAEVLTGPPELRRRLLDRGVLGLRPPALAALGRFRRALGHKRSLLAGGGGGLEAWNQVLAGAAAEVIAARAAYAERLQVALAEALTATGLPYGALELRYRPSPPDGLAGAEAVQAALAKAAAEERRRGQPLLGPQRDDLAVRWRGRELARVASAGERKAFAVVVAAAHGRVLAAGGRRPVYLLDDLDTELSVGTLAAVWEAFSGVEQLFATSNRPAAWSALGLEARWGLAEGRIEAL